MEGIILILKILRF